MRALLRMGVCALAACADHARPDDPVDPADHEQVDLGPEETDGIDPPAPAEIARDNDELAQVLSAHVRGEFPIMLALAEVAKGRVPPGFELADDGTGTATMQGMVLVFSYWCNAGDGMHTIVPCDSAAHHGHFQLALTGASTVGSIAIDGIERHVNWEIRDILFDKARFRGPDDVALHASIAGTDGVVSSYSLNFDATYEKVRFMPAEPIPTYGTIDFVLNVERHRGDDRRVFVTSAQLVYGAPGVPTTLTFDGGPVYTLGLDPEPS